MFNTFAFNKFVRRIAAVSAATLMFGAAPNAAAPAAPQGTLTWGLSLSLTSTFFDPGETPGTGAPLLLQYAQHDAVIRPIAGNPSGLSLADKLEQSDDGLTYTFTLRPNLRFQNGDALTAEDVKFSFDRYRGAGAKLLKDKVAEVAVLDPLRVRFKLKEPWPDFLTFYGTTATGAAWVLPKKYIEEVGDEGFKKAPIGAGPYRLKAFKPGIEFNFEASEHYWRKTPNVKNLVFRYIPDPATRLAAIKRGEVDFAYALTGALGEEARRTKGLTLKTANIPVTNFIVFASQYDEKSPWSNPKVREAADIAVDRKAINDASYMGLARESYSAIPQAMAFYWNPPQSVYDPARAKKLLAEAGYPNGFDGGFLHTDASDQIGEPVQSYLAEVGIRVQLRPSERAAHLKQVAEKKLTGLVLTGSGAPGNAATRLDQFVRTGGSMSYVKDADIDTLLDQQSRELNKEKRTAQLAQVQTLLSERQRFLPVLEYAFVIVTGPRVGVDGVNLIPDNPYTGPYEDLTIKPGQ
ncbi:ABC transporter substrate-binding protein [Pigmentiphaga aceris]|uniref:ABC transporter substrate-binding protein n=1 Tax=Pigmentiphaga aceris TaxID=1940612 RepID=A0A5C0AW44_9BURK|nr:ABC transporter substrate-binding protein [Pigmentiphaga aceris]QEI06609.1 ABC transporter substrate-binding protein [Pigmentiphaga aceris]